MDAVTKNNDELEQKIRILEEQISKIRRELGEVCAQRGLEGVCLDFQMWPTPFCATGNQMDYCRKGLKHIGEPGKMQGFLAPEGLEMKNVMKFCTSLINKFRRESGQTCRFCSKGIDDHPSGGWCKSYASSSSYSSNQWYSWENRDEETAKIEDEATNKQLQDDI